jgi:hypothetical protein
MPDSANRREEVARAARADQTVLQDIQMLQACRMKVAAFTANRPGPQAFLARLSLPAKNARRGMRAA